MSWIFTSCHNCSLTSNISNWETINTKYGLLLYCFDNRFNNDKAIIINDKFSLISDGVILNKYELLSSGGVDSLTGLFIKNVDNIMGLVRHFSGPFTGIKVDSNSLIAYGNQTGDTTVFYYCDNNIFAVSTDFTELFGLCKANGWALDFDEDSAHNMLTYGYLTKGRTFARQIRRTLPGDYFEVQFHSNQIACHAYHRFDNTKALNVSMDEAIDMIDNVFKKAVKRCLDKNLEYGYKHIIDISGGLDCRMVSVIASELGYNNILNVHYSKKDSDEEKCAFEMSKRLGIPFLDFPLDDLSFFTFIDDIIPQNYGLACYNSITGARNLLSYINFQTYGLEITGQLGDVLIGSYNHDERHYPPNPASIAFNWTLTQTVNTDEISDYPNHELCAMYNRGFLGILATHYTRSRYTTAVSPFIDPDFIDVCFSIPLEYRYNHRLYWKWIDKYHPIAASVNSTTERPEKSERVTPRKIIVKFLGKNKQKVARILNRAGMYSIVSNPNTMNPLDYWYNTNPHISAFMDNYFDTIMNSINCSQELKKSISDVFHEEREVNKAVALTVLGAYKAYWM